LIHTSHKKSGTTPTIDIKRVEIPEVEIMTHEPEKDPSKDASKRATGRVQPKGPERLKELAWTQEMVLVIFDVNIKR